MKKIILVTTSILIILSLQISVFAFEPYFGYAYDEFGRYVPSISGYAPYKSFYTDSQGSFSFSSISDLHIDRQGNIYVLDSGTGSIIVMDNNYTIIDTIYEFKDEAGTEYSLNSPESIFLTEDLIYVADSDNFRVLIMDKSGKVIKSVGKPESEIFPQHREFRPSKVIADSVGNFYVIVSGVFQGSATFDRNGEFIEFFGSDRVELSARLLRDYLWRRFVTEEMRERLARYVPVEFISFDIDESNFIYSVTQRTSRSGQIRKINPAGVNIWNPARNYGDIEFSMRRGRMVDTYFSDVTINSRGFLFALDTTRNRIFTYDNEGDFIFTFGGRGDQTGTFREPRIIESFGDKIYVYDSAKGSITEFVPNEYGSIVLDAIEMFQDGRYIESKEMWENVLRRNSNNYLAYVGIGKALYQTGDYEEAMKYHTLGGSKLQESLAFSQHRSDLIRDNFLYIVLGILLIIISAAIFKRRNTIAASYKLWRARK